MNTSKQALISLALTICGWSFAIRGMTFWVGALGGELWLSTPMASRTQHSRILILDQETTMDQQSPLVPEYKGLNCSSWAVLKTHP